MAEDKKLPKSWEWKKLGDICQLIMGQAPPSSTYNNKGEGSLFIRAGDFGSIYPSSSVYTTKPLNFSKEGDVLLCVVGATSGKVNLAINGAITRSIFALRPNDQIIQKYLFYFLKINYNKLNQSKSGSAQGIINGKTLRAFGIPLPPIQIQKKIVNILEQAERLKQRRGRANEETSKVLQAIFNNMFGDPIKNEKEWKKYTLLDLSKEKPQYGSGAKAINYNNKIRYIRITDVKEDGNLKDEKVSPSEFEEKYILKKGDLLFARSGATVGKTYLHLDNLDNSIYAGYMIRFRLDEDKCNYRFIYEFTKSNYYKNWIKSTQTQVAQPNVNARQFGEFKVLVPPLELQNKFAELVEKVEKIKKHQEKTTQEINTLFDALMQKAFNGELKV